MLKNKKNGRKKEEIDRGNRRAKKTECQNQMHRNQRARAVSACDVSGTFHSSFTSQSMTLVFSVELFAPRCCRTAVCCCCGRAKRENIHQHVVESIRIHVVLRLVLVRVVTSAHAATGAAEVSRAPPVLGVASSARRCSSPLRTLQLVQRKCPELPPSSTRRAARVVHLFAVLALAGSRWVDHLYQHSIKSSTNDSPPAPGLARTVSSPHPPQPFGQSDCGPHSLE
jgi:hypothetical protein